MSDLQILFPKPVVIDVQGRVVEVRPVQLRHFEAFSQAASSLFMLLANSSIDEVYAYGRDTGALRAIVGHCTNLSAWRIRRLPAAVAVQLMVVVAQVNASFFDQALQAMASTLAGLTQPSN